MKKKIINNVSWVGCIDWELQKFHGDDYLIRNGSSQNAYLVEEEKNFLIDTVWTPNRCEFIKNLKNEVDLKKLDFIVMNHGEPDHSGALPCLVEKIPNIPIYCSLGAQKTLSLQYKKDFNFKVVKTGDEIDIGNGKKLKFLNMTMLHWPDSLATYLTKDNVLFSNDAFGQHLATAELFADLVDPLILEKESLKYFVNILNPFAEILSKKLEEIEKLNLKIDIIAPSHGAIYRKNPEHIVANYKKWSKEYKEDQITICYDTMWGGTKKIAENIAEQIQLKSPSTRVKLFNVSKADKNEITTQIFKSFAVFFGSPTVNNSIMSSMAGFLEFLKQLKFKNKKAGVFSCYGWSGEAALILETKLKEAGFEVKGSPVKSLFNPTKEVFENVSNLVSSVF